jgi:hypothetical protein
MTPTPFEGPGIDSPDGDWSDEELREMQAFIDEVREEIWWESQRVEPPIIVEARETDQCYDGA